MAPWQVREIHRGQGASLVIGLTALVAIIAIALAARVHPVRALGILIATMYLYPEYLRIPIGLAEMSAPRFVALFLLARFLSSPVRRAFRWRRIDTVVCVAWGWSVVAAIVAGAEYHQVTEVIGRVFDTVLIYFVARLSFAGSDDYGKLLLPLAVTACVMGVIGVAEALTSHSPYQWMQAYASWTWVEKAPEYRYGLLRAQASMGHSIYFGMAMFLLLGVLLAIRGYCQSKLLWGIACLAALLGALSSMSSGPQQALVLLAITSAFYFYPAALKPAIVMMILGGIFLEIGSNRHFWYLMEYVNFFGGDYWYRARLIEVAAQQWREYWLIGVGSNLPMHWGMMIDGRQHVDIVNHYIIVAISSGFLGLGLFVAAEVLGLRDLVRAWPKADLPRRKLIFGLGATLVALMLSIFSVGLYSVPLLMSYTLFALVVCDPAAKRKRRVIVYYPPDFDGQDASALDRDRAGAGVSLPT